MIFPVSNKVHKMYKPLKASVFCCVYDAGSSLRGEKHTICAFGLEIGVHQHFNQMISNYIFGVLQQALKLRRSALQIPEPQLLVLWTAFGSVNMVETLLFSFCICDLFLCFYEHNFQETTKTQRTISRLAHITADSLKWKQSVCNFSF